MISLFFLLVGSRNFLLFIMLIRDESLPLAAIWLYVLIFGVFSGSSSVFKIIIIIVTNYSNIVVIISLKSWS